MMLGDKSAGGRVIDCLDRVGGRIDDDEIIDEPGPAFAPSLAAGCKHGGDLHRIANATPLPFRLAPMSLAG
jgi:hypothetical protein